MTGTTPPSPDRSSNAPARRPGGRAALAAAGLLLALSAAVGCGDDDGGAPAADAGVDATATDLGPPPADLGGDGGPATPDGGEGDGGRPDGGRPDGGDADAGGADLGPAEPPCGAPTLPPLDTVAVAGGTRFSSPVGLTFAPGDRGAVYVVERAGRIRRVAPDGTVTEFANLTGAIGTAPSGNDERGLLGLAFHPDYARNGRFFVGYTPTRGGGVNVVAEYARMPGSSPPVAAPGEVARLVAQDDPAGNHNGGWVAFGPDGFLYAALGDGGSGGDPYGPIGNGQNLDTLLGKILRLDVDAAARGYAAAGNPFASGGGRPQIWAYGLRNPWRNSFDRATGDLWLADVGQGAREEIDFQPARSRGGENYGWRAFEGTATYDATLAATVTHHTPPIHDYRHGSDAVLSGGRSVVGGYVYRGAALPGLRGTYLFGDTFSEHVAALRYCDGTLHGPVRVPDLRALASTLVSFGEDEAGELYLVYLDGTVLRIVPRG
jgi:glucose/arabinose dehydrogenase